jgi:hypothetical protein
MKGRRVARGIYLLEEVYFHPMNSTNPREYLQWLVNYKKEDEQRTDSDAELTQGLSVRSRAIDLVGAFYAIGITGHEQFKAVTLWDCHGGWDGGWRQQLDIYNGVKPELFLSSIDNLRHKAFSRPMGAVRGTPDLQELRAEQYTAPFFLHEIAQVRPGAAQDYLAAVREDRAPILADHGHRLVGLYEVMLSDTEVVTFWGTDIDSHLETQRAYDAAVGLDAEATADPRLVEWRKSARQYLDGPWRETLLAPFPGSVLAPK